jgi:hypothetical protein
MLVALAALSAPSPALAQESRGDRGDRGDLAYLDYRAQQERLSYLAPPDPPWAQVDRGVSWLLGPTGTRDGAILCGKNLESNSRYEHWYLESGFVPGAGFGFVWAHPPPLSDADRPPGWEDRPYFGLPEVNVTVLPSLAETAGLTETDGIERWTFELVQYDDLGIGDVGVGGGIQYEPLPEEGGEIRGYLHRERHTKNGTILIVDNWVFTDTYVPPSKNYGGLVRLFPVYGPFDDTAAFYAWIHGGDTTGWAATVVDYVEQKGWDAPF